MKSFIVLASSLILTSTCYAMNNPPGGDNNLRLRSSAPATTTQPGVIPIHEAPPVDLSTMSVNSRTQHMTNFVAGQLVKGTCSYEQRLLGLESQHQTQSPAQSSKTPKGQPVHTPVPHQRHLDRTLSAGPQLESIAHPPHRSSPSVVPPHDSDDEASEDMNKKLPGNDLVFDMD